MCLKSYLPTTNNILYNIAINNVFSVYAQITIVQTGAFGKANTGDGYILSVEWFLFFKGMVRTKGEEVNHIFILTIKPAPLP